MANYTWGDEDENATSSRRLLASSSRDFIKGYEKFTAVVRASTKVSGAGDKLRIVSQGRSTDFKHNMRPVS